MSKGRLDLFEIWTKVRRQNNKGRVSPHAPNTIRTGNCKCFRPTCAAACGGRFRPLTKAAEAHIADTAFAILDRIGMAGATPDIRSLALAGGATDRGDGRLRFSRALIEDAIAGACKRVELPGFDSRRGIEVGGGRVHIGTGGAAVQVLDSDGRVFATARSAISSG